MKYDLPYYNDLLKIRSFLESYFPKHGLYRGDKGFPYDKCQYASGLVSHVLGLEEVAGQYAGYDLFHAWNIDTKQKVHVDVSLDQFNSRVGSIAIISFNDRFEDSQKLILEPNAKRTKKLFKEKNNLGKRDIEIPSLQDVIADYQRKNR